MRLLVYRSAVASYSATGIVTIADNQLPASRPGMSLVGVCYSLRSSLNTTAVTDWTRVRLRTQSDTFYDQLVVHDRLWQERFGYRGYPDLGTAGQSSTTMTNSGGFTIWLNDQRAMTPDFQDSMAAPLNSGIVHEITVGTVPASSTVTIDVVGIYSTVTPTRVHRRVSSVLNLPASTTGGTRNIDDRGVLLAYGVPHVNTSPAANLQRFRLKTGGVEIADGSPALHYCSELDEAPWSLSGSLAATAGATTVLWKSTRGFEFPAAATASLVTIDTGTTALTTTEMPVWTYTAQGG